ncbi:acyl-CoA dehydrogenase family protein [Deinococcus radiomollis]|uniref:acyl-CoA dehydrogenase family protein n=1 Tax=Deinococcus radiomollis TaxID=468916 RepID=UPI003891A186
MTLARTTASPPPTRPDPPSRTEQARQIAEPLAAVFRQEAEQADRSEQLSAVGVRAIKASGYPALTVPARLGGFGASLHEFALAQELLGRADASLALVAAMNAHLLGSVGEAESWPEEVYAELAHSSVQKGALSNSLASEPDLGSPSRGGLPSSSAQRVEGGWRVSGLKTWSTGSEALDFLVVTAAVDEEVWRFVIPQSTEGVQVQQTWQGSLSLRGSGSHDVKFEDVFVPDRHALPPTTPLSPVQAASSGAWFWTAVAATYLGVGQAALDSFVAYANERVPTALGASIATLPKIQQAAGQMNLDLLSARTLLHHLTRRWAAEPEARPELLPQLAGAKNLCTNAAVSVTDLALRAAGGAALTAGLPLERYFRDARAGLTHPPADDQALSLLGKQALGL